MKKLVVFTLLICLTLVCFAGVTATAFAEANDVEAALDLRVEGEEILATVSLVKNDGIVDLYLRVEYDTDALELLSRDFGKTLASLDPVDNFEEGKYEYPYRVIYAGSGSNNKETGALFFLRFKIKDGAAGNHNVKLVVRQVGYLTSGSGAEPVYNTKYGEPIDLMNASSAKTGGVTVSDKTVAIGISGEVKVVETPAPEKEGKNELMIGLIVGGVMIVVGAVIIAYIAYRKKQNDTNDPKQND